MLRPHRLDEHWRQLGGNGQHLGRERRGAGSRPGAPLRRRGFRAATREKLFCGRLRRRRGLDGSGRYGATPLWGAPG